MGKRRFRSPESYEFEEVTRAMLPGFLRERGYIVERDMRERQGQTIVVRSPEGEHLSARVRLCWRRDSRVQDSQRSRTYSAAQLLAKIENDDWIGSLRGKVNREKSRGVTHFLIVQRVDEIITHAALVPISELVEIWVAQRDISQRLIDHGKLGARRKNHAQNGSSPTIWLEDEPGGTEIADVLWNHPGVRNLTAISSSITITLLPEEIAQPSLYVEGASRVVAVNAYERNSRARLRCIEHYGAQCCICRFSFGDVYGYEAVGYIHGHHVRALSEVGGEYQVDPIKDLRPVCPNCHAVLHLGGRCRTIEEVRCLLH